jgi:hypothetical protein
MNGLGNRERSGRCCDPSDELRGAGQGGRPWGGGRGRCWGGGRGASEGRGSSEAASAGEARPPWLKDLLGSLDRRVKVLEERLAQGPPAEP